MTKKEMVYEILSNTNLSCINEIELNKQILKIKKKQLLKIYINYLKKIQINRLIISITFYVW